MKIFLQQSRQTTASPPRRRSPTPSAAPSASSTRTAATATSELQTPMKSFVMETIAVKAAKFGIDYGVGRRMMKNTFSFNFTHSSTYRGSNRLKPNTSIQNRLLFISYSCAHSRPLSAYLARRSVITDMKHLESTRWTRRRNLDIFRSPSTIT